MNSPLAVFGSSYVAYDEHVASEPIKLDLSLLERTLRRGLSEVTRLFMHAARLALADAELAPEQVHVLFASAFGEIAVAEALLAEAHDANGSSPARFRHSVHNTATGLLSISAKSRLPSTALAAGWDTVAMALCEATALLDAEAEHVLVVFAEERVPSALSADHPYPPLAVALALGRARARPRAWLANLRREPRDEALAAAQARAFGPEDHPLGPALALARALEARDAQTLVVGSGERPWCVDLRVEEGS